MAGKYKPLEKYLSDLPKSTHEITLSFEEIERILKFKLPPSAYESPKWWEHEKEGNHINMRAWSNAGWKVDSVDNEKTWVRFRRV